MSTKRLNTTGVWETNLQVDTPLPLKLSLQDLSSSPYGLEERIDPLSQQLFISDRFNVRLSGRVVDGTLHLTVEMQCKK